MINNDGTGTISASRHIGPGGNQDVSTDSASRLISPGGYGDNQDISSDCSNESLNVFPFRYLNVIYIVWYVYQLFYYCNVWSVF